MPFKSKEKSLTDTDKYYINYNAEYDKNYLTNEENDIDHIINESDKNNISEVMIYVPKSIEEIREEIIKEKEEKIN